MDTSASSEIETVRPRSEPICAAALPAKNEASFRLASRSIACNTRLELEPRRELKLPRLSPRWLAGDKHRPLIDIDRRGISVRIAGVDVVKRVIGIQPELREQALMDCEILLHCHVRVKEVRTKLRVTAGVANLVQARSGKIPL